MTFSNAVKSLISEDINKAETFWIKETQKLITVDAIKRNYKRLSPKFRDDGIIIVGGRIERWVQMSYNENEIILLPHAHRFSRLYAEYIHERGYYGVAATASKVHSKFWMPQIHKLVKSIRFNCVTCKKLDKQLCTQAMGKLPEERLKPTPPWYYTALDMFGPFKIRDAVKKRTFGKAYGVILNCMVSRTVHVDISADYSTEKFIMVLRRFVSLRGYPKKLFSDNWTQLVAANEELQRVTKGWNWQELNEFGICEGMD